LYADAVGAVCPRHAVLVARIGVRDHLHQQRIEVREIRDLRLVELLVDAGLDLLGHVVRGRHDDVVARAAGEQLRLQRVVAVVVVVRTLMPVCFWKFGIVSGAM
jgi:hypothetical protein